jgi:hypothetical protein
MRYELGMVKRFYAEGRRDTEVTEKRKNLGAGEGLPAAAA